MLARSLRPDASGAGLLAAFRRSGSGALVVVVSLLFSLLEEAFAPMNSRVNFGAYGDKADTLIMLSDTQTRADKTEVPLVPRTILGFAATGRERWRRPTRTRTLKKSWESQRQTQAASIERRAPTAVELPRAAYLTNNYCWNASARLLMATAVRDIERAKPALQHGLDDAPASRAK